MLRGQNAYIMGIALTVLTHAGPQIVYFHECPVPIEYRPDMDNDIQDSDSSDEIVWSSDEDSSDIGSITNSLTSSALSRPAERTRARIDHSAHRARKAQFDDPLESQTKRNGHADLGSSSPQRLIFDYEPSHLAEMLCPPEVLSNQRFELLVDDIVYVSLPVHINSDGEWRNKSKARKTRARARTLETGSLRSGAAMEPMVEPENSESEGESDSDDSENKQHLHTASDPRSSRLRQFSVTFMLNPPINEVQSITDQVYYFVLVQLAKALRSLQASKDYVWREIQRIISVRDDYLAENEQASETQLSAMAADASELANSLCILCDELAALNIARISLDGKIRAFQLPKEAEVTSLPLNTQMDPVTLYPTTCKLASKEIDEKCLDSYALLLLATPERIVQQLEVDANGPIAAIVRALEPFVSLEELARQAHISSSQMAALAHSLAYWRCARVIVPLNQRHTYAVSPLAPMDKLGNLSRDFRLHFPMMPALPRLLSVLSGAKPQPFTAHIPSRDHHNVYMQSLAWLMRSRLVVQMYTFALVVVTRKVKMAVQEELDNEEISAVKTTEPHPTKQTDYSTDNTSKQFSGQQYQKQTLDRPSDPLAEKLPIESYSRRNSEGDVPVGGEQPNLQEKLNSVTFTDTILHEPLQAKFVEKRWLTQITAGQSAEMSALFFRLLKYFNGKDCLEQVTYHEKVSRAELRRFLRAYQDSLIVYRHW